MRRLFVIMFSFLLGLPVLGLLASQPTLDALACSGPNINITNPSGGATLSNTVVLESVTSAPVAGVEYSVRPVPVNTTIAPIILGPATSLPTDPTRWSMSWATNGLPNGQYYLFARAIYPTGSTISECLSNPTSIAISNGTATNAPILTVSIQPAAWEGPTNVRAALKATVAYKNSAGVVTDVSGPSTYSWSTTIGSLGGGGQSIDFYSGPQDGTGQLNVAAHYNNLTATASAALKIYAASTYTTPSPSPQPQTSTSPTPPAGGSAGPVLTPRPTTPPISVVAGSKEASCLEKSLGSARFNAINSGLSQPTADERRKGAACFANAGMVPSPLAPVAPNDVRRLDVETSDKLVVDEAKQESKQDGKGKTKKTIKLSGKATPNSEIYLYVFSEPLVLKTRTDSAGNWNYTLENPLKAGQHEVYATTEKSPSKYVRSEPLLINVAPAIASEQNPQGNSLDLAQASQSGLLYYIGGAILLTLVGLRLLLLVHKRFKKKPVEIEAIPTQPTI